jgi:hypothetical protein
MRRAALLVCLLLIGLCTGAMLLRDPAAETTERAQAWVKMLTNEQRAIALMPYTDKRRMDWHFIPKAERKGLQYKNMSAEQKVATLNMLRSVLSQLGYEKATTIMSLESILKELEKNKVGGNIRDNERYFVTIFGEPGPTGDWALSFEGHHLSLNFAWKDGKFTSTTPTFFGSNPAVVHSTVSGTPQAGYRALKLEEDLAFELVNALDAEQQKLAILAPKAPKDIQDAGAAQVTKLNPNGIKWGQLKTEQQDLLKKLIKTYAENLPATVAEERLLAIDKAGWEKVYFAWQGATKPGIGHHYAIIGPTFLIELNNTQPDAEGNIANHIHSIWRDLRGDFALPRVTDGH